jgi:SAM-dependent methyltransferase
MNAFLKEREETRRFFNRAVFVFPIIERSLFPEYRRTLKKLNLDTNYTVLDLATGTGILAGAFAERGHQTAGYDFAEKMLNRARRKFPLVEFRHFDLFNLENLASGSYDITAMGYFLHGIDPQFRKQILFHAARIARKYVIIFDYCCQGSLLVRFIEWLEGPHYDQFIESKRSEEFESAGLVIEEEINLSEYGSVWVCCKKTADALLS